MAVATAVMMTNANTPYSIQCRASPVTLINLSSPLPRDINMGFPEVDQLRAAIASRYEDVAFQLNSTWTAESPTAPELHQQRRLPAPVPETAGNNPALPPPAPGSGSSPRPAAKALPDPARSAAYPRYTAPRPWHRPRPAAAS